MINGQIEHDEIEIEKRENTYKESDYLEANGPVFVMVECIEHVVSIGSRVWNHWT